MVDRVAIEVYRTDIGLPSHPLLQLGHAPSRDAKGVRWFDEILSDSFLLTLGPLPDQLV